MRFSPRGDHREDQEEDEDIFAEKPLEELLKARNDFIVGSRRCVSRWGAFLMHQTMVISTHQHV